MELYRTIPEWVDMYNAETAVHKALADSKLMTKLVGGPAHERVTLDMNAVASELAGKSDTDVAKEPTKELVVKDAEPEKIRPFIRAPLEWDRNWQWDF